jgi:hypothetical protein
VRSLRDTELRKFVVVFSTQTSNTDKVLVL